MYRAQCLHRNLWIVNLWVYLSIIITVGRRTALQNLRERINDKKLQQQQQAFRFVSSILLELTLLLQSFFFIFSVNRHTLRSYQSYIQTFYVGNWMVFLWKRFVFFFLLFFALVHFAYSSIAVGKTMTKKGTDARKEERTITEIYGFWLRCIFFFFLLLSWFGTFIAGRVLVTITHPYIIWLPSVYNTY